jgi:hypothetical protein
MTPRELRDALDALDQRVTHLEEICAKLNVDDLLSSCKMFQDIMDRLEAKIDAMMKNGNGKH